MKKIVDNISLHAYSSKLFNAYFGEKSFVVFDIETTGLSPAKSKVVLTGLLTVTSDGSAQVTQYFADQNDDEEAVIKATIDHLKDADYIITYNGRHFDVPFMKKRAEQYGLTFPDLYNLDLYLLISGFAPFKEVLPGLKQKSIEIYMGLSDGREDMISGKESVDLYHRFMETRQLELEHKILLHNHDDIIQLYKILPIVDRLDFHKALYKRGFVAGRFVIEQIGLKGKELVVKAKQYQNPTDYISFPTEEKPYSLMMNSSDQQTQLTIPCECEAGALFIDAQRILGPVIDKIEQFPSVTNGYLILSQNNQVNEMEVNAFVKTFFQEEIYAI